MRGILKVPELPRTSHVKQLLDDVYEAKSAGGSAQPSPVDLQLQQAWSAWTSRPNTGLQKTNMLRILNNALGKFVFVWSFLYARSLQLIFLRLEKMKLSYLFHVQHNCTTRKNSVIYYTRGNAPGLRLENGIHIWSKESPPMAMISLAFM